MLAVGNQPSWMPSVLGDAASTQPVSSGKPSEAPARDTPRELALAPPEDQPDNSEFSLFGADGFSFADLVDVINPLQHIPLVSTFYREMSGDQIAPAPRVIGSSLFFGPLGFVGAMANIMVEENTGKDIGQHMASWVEPEPLPDKGYVPGPGEQKPATSGDPEDPVIAWARGEIAWARQGRQDQERSRHDDTPRQNPAADTPDLPDAAPFLHNDPAPAPGPVDYAQTVTLSRDLRSAAWAYEAAANLRAAGPG